MDLTPQLLSIFTFGFIGGSIPGSILASIFRDSLSVIEHNILCCIDIIVI